MRWLQSDSEIEQIVKNDKQLIAIFKHSTRCPISARAWNQMQLIENKWKTTVIFVGVDVIDKRSISQKIATIFNIRHESPQVLVVRNGNCIYDRSHFQITESEFSTIMTSVGELS